MITYIIIFGMLAISIMAIIIRKAYFSIPLTELKRQSARGNKQAQQLLQTVNYGGSLDLLLWLLIIVPSATCLILLNRVIDSWLSLLVISLFLYIVYVLLPAIKPIGKGNMLAIALTPLIVKLLKYLHKPLDKIDTIINKLKSNPHTGLYERADLINLIRQQSKQLDSRFSHEELNITSQILIFQDISVQDIALPWSKVKYLLANDIIGPIVIDEVHKSGQPLIPVIDVINREERILGVLRVAQLGLSSEGRAYDLMDTAIYYINQEDSLAETLQAFYVTNEPQFIVIDNKGYHQGIVTMQALLGRLLGNIDAIDAAFYLEKENIINRRKLTAKKNQGQSSKDNSKTNFEDKA